MEHPEHLAAWLTAHLDDADDVTVGTVETPTGGYSAETLIVPITVTRHGVTTDEQVVVRREMPEPPVYPVQVPVENEIEIQWKVMSALVAQQDTAAVPIAPLLGYETDPSVLGSPFFVMGFIGGEIPREDPLYVAEGFYVDAEPAQRSAMIRGGIEVMAGIHAVDVAAAGLDWLAPEGSVNDGRRQLRIWRDYAERELDGRPHPLMLAAFDRLEDELPAGGAPVLNWGDARLGNVIWDDFAPACVTDFEAASIGPAEMDVGWWIMFEQWAHVGAGVDRHPGTLPVAEQLAHYEAVSGRTLEPIDPWVLFAATRYAAIVVRVMNRMVQRGLLPPEQTLYLDPIDATLRPLVER
ncbi:MAG: phosphotransferase family protein [Acidimicrobiales bacterium]